MTPPWSRLIRVCALPCVFLIARPRDRGRVKESHLHQRTIRFWLTWLVVGCVLPATLGTAFLFTISYQQQRAILERNTIATARALMQAIDAELFGAQSALQVLAASHRLASGDLASFYLQASEALPNIGGNYIAITDSTGQQRLNTLKPFGDPLPQVLPSAKMRRVFENGKPAISDFFVVPEVGQSAITLEVPVFSNGKVIYSLAMAIFADRLADILHRQNIPPDWITAVFDSTGTIAARTHSPQRFVGGKGSAGFLLRSANRAEGITEADSLDPVASRPGPRARNAGIAVDSGQRNRRSQRRRPGADEGLANDQGARGGARARRIGHPGNDAGKANRRPNQPREVGVPCIDEPRATDTAECDLGLCPIAGSVRRCARPRKADSLCEEHRGSEHPAGKNH